MIQIGSQDDILRALLAKNVDAAVLGYPAVYVAKKSGLRELTCEAGPQVVNGWSADGVDDVQGPGIALGPEITQFLCVSQLP
jgi:hypothetical protein